MKIIKCGVRISLFLGLVFYTHSPVWAQMDSAAQGISASQVQNESEETKSTQAFVTELGEDYLLSPLDEVVKPKLSTGEFTELSLEKAIEYASESHLLARLAKSGIGEAKGRNWQVFSTLFPHVSGNTYFKRTYRENLTAMGFKTGGLIGPFNTFDARFELTQKLFDLSAVSQAAASHTGVKLSKLEQQLADQKIIMLTAMAYLEALRAYSEQKAAEADLQLAERLLDQAKKQNQVGVATGVDVARAETRVAEQRLRFEKARMDGHDTLLGLQRVTNLSYDSAIRLTNSLVFVEEDQWSISEAVGTAESKRLEIQIGEAQVGAAKYQFWAAAAEVLPKADFMGDVGVMGNDIDNRGRSTGSAMFRVSVPIFESGQNAGKIRETRNKKLQQEYRLEDLKRQVEEDVRLSLWAVRIGVSQVRAASKVVELAKRELDLSTNRFSQGVADNIEVMNAQAALARARDELIEALVHYHTTRLNLYFAIGTAETFRLSSTN